MWDQSCPLLAPAMLDDWCCLFQASGVPLVETASPWQKQLLQQLSFLGPNANAEVTIGREPAAEPRFLAALRTLNATAASDLRQRSMQQLGDWHAPLAPHIEVFP